LRASPGHPARSTIDECNTALASAGRDRPLVSRVRYCPLGFAVLFTAAANSRKLRNIAADPRVSVGVSAPLAGLAGSRGAHLFGTATVLDPDHPDPARYWKASRCGNGHDGNSRRVSGRRRDTLVIVEPERIVYSEQSLRDDGFASPQFWHR
jgi:hypothetical protein